MNMVLRKILLILLLWISVFEVQAQSRWITGYYLEKDAVGYSFVEAYDYGYFIVGKHGHNYVHYNWLIKTDINGQELWGKTIGNPSSYTTIVHTDIIEYGKSYCAGTTTFYDEYGDPLIIKLDSCGNKEWCKVFYTPDNFDYANFVMAMDDGGCIAILRYTGDDPTGQVDRICLVKLTGDGELEWRQCYNSADSGIINSDARYLTLTPDGGYLITASCGYPDPVHPNMYWTKPYYIKTDYLGNFQWETVVHKDVGGEAGGEAWSTALNPDKSYYYSSLSHYYPDHNTGALLKMDLDGNVIVIYDLISGYENGGLAHSTFINDTIIAGSAGWGNTADDIVNHAVLMDTLGNILKYTDLIQDIYGSILEVSFDTKLVYMYNTYQNGQFDVYLRKLNQDLEDDTLYSFPFQYDTLCPYPIASDTIPLDDCNLIVGIEEKEENGRMGEEKEELFNLYPNPASDKIHCSFQIAHSTFEILIYDMYGRKMDEVLVPAGQQEMTIDVSSYSKGIYIAVLKSQKGILGRRKFVVVRQ